MKCTYIYICKENPPTDKHTMTYYDEIADSYEELHGEEQRKKLRLIKKIWNPQGSITDIGCGTGIACEFFNISTGIDPSEKLLEKARCKHPNTRFIKAKAEKLPFKNKEFKRFISLTAIQNFENINQALREIKRVAERGIISFIKRTSRKKEIISAIKKHFTIIKEIEEEKDIILLIKEKKNF